jgi:hypothetical protein
MNKSGKQTHNLSECGLNPFFHLRLLISLDRLTSPFSILLPTGRKMNLSSFLSRVFSMAIRCVDPFTAVLELAHAGMLTRIK